MGESTALVHALFIIVSLVVAGSVAVAVIGKMSSVLSKFSIMLEEKTREMGTRIDIIYAYYNSTTGYYVIYVKNVGSEPYSALDRIDIYIGPYDGHLDLYTYNETASTGHWNYTETYQANGIWDPGETLIIKVNTGKDYGSPFKVRVALISGLSDEDVFQ